VVKFIVSGALVAKAREALLQIAPYRQKEGGLGSPVTISSVVNKANL